MTVSTDTGIEKTAPTRKRRQSADEQIGDNPSPRSTPPRWVGFAWAAATVALVAALLGFAWQRSRPITKPIGEVRVGDRVKAHNPELSDFNRASALEIDPTTWRLVALRMNKSDGTRLEIDLLRPPSWIAAHRAAVGSMIELELADLGAAGPAEVVSIEHCPPIRTGAGHIVTGTFHHQSTQVLDLAIDGLAHPIGVTANHPFWSDDRQQFVAAGDLRENEIVRTVSGQARVVGITARGDSAHVYNLEVETEHTYYVSAIGALVHNQCTHLHHTIPRQVRKSRRTGESMLPEHLIDDPDIVGKAGNPNRWPVPADEHINLHKRNRPGGDFNTRWEEELGALEELKPDKSTWTKEDILDIRDRLAKEFDIEKYRPK